MNTSVAYAFPERALRRWCNDRLTLDERGEAVQAEFRFEGSTCGNVAFRLNYRVRLAREADGFRIREMSCAPAESDLGHTRMCSYLEDAQRLLGILREERPLLGEPLAAVIAWRPAISPAGCVCAAASRAHKWLAVLQTIHFALAGRGARVPVSTS